MELSSTASRKRILWLDAAKFIAILGVLLDHAEGTVYTSPLIKMASYYAVSLFIFIAGMTSYLSNQRCQRTCLQEFWHSSKRMLFAYVLATFVLQICSGIAWRKDIYFAFDAFVEHLIYFNVSAPFYYVALYLQLMLLSRLLYCCVESFPERGRILWELLFGVFLLLFAVFSIYRTNILWLYGGAGKLFGGTYLFLYYLGMLLMKHRVFVPATRKRSLVFIAVTAPLLATWFAMIYLTQRSIDAYFPFDFGLNPPSVSLSVYAILVLFLAYGCFSLLETIPSLHRLLEAAAFVGRHTLYVFLYHMIVLTFFAERLPSTPVTPLLLLVLAIFLPIAWECVVNIIFRFFRQRIQPEA